VERLVYRCRTCGAIQTAPIVPDEAFTSLPVCLACESPDTIGVTTPDGDTLADAYVRLRIMQDMPLAIALAVVRSQTRGITVSVYGMCMKYGVSRSQVRRIIAELDIALEALKPKGPRINGNAENENATDPSQLARSLG
jgi:hypothetical protein